jgi:hypothetical protein
MKDMLSVAARIATVVALVGNLVALPLSRPQPHTPLLTGRVASCPRPAPASAADYNNVLAHVTGWQAGDGGQTAVIPGGRRVWSFGDSLGGDNQLHHNALVVQTGGCAASLAPTADYVPGQLCGDDPSTPTEEGWCWGGPLGYAAQTARLYMLAPQVARTPDCTGAFCFTGVGTRLFAYSLSTAGKPVLQTAVPVPATNGIFWNAALMISQAGLGAQMAYVYGYRDDGDPWTFGFDVYLAVVPVATLLDLDTWTYRTASGWSTSAADAAPILGAAGGPETGFSVTVDGGGTTLTSTADGGLGHVVTAWHSATPWGPWSSSALADYPDTSDHMWYLPLVVAGTGLHVISQNWPNRPLSDIVTSPQDFRVQVF